MATKKDDPKKAEKAVAGTGKAAAKATADSKSPAPAGKSPAPAQPAGAAAGEAVNKPVTPVEKTAVEAPSQQEVKPAIKPLEKTAGKTTKGDPASGKAAPEPSPNQEQSTRMRYSDAELTEFRELINRKLETAKKELNYLQGLITRKDESGDLDEGRYMTMEDGSMSMEREQLSQMASRQIQFIDHLEKAMMRIENKTYGVCRVTGKLIDKARLRAVPHATLSIEAKQMMNK
ncbi:TraR/DksA C4-type zinc finger protein [Paraflavisolibacter sp. H34]|uniref:TraR/DksA family transcriptional regulator n=1 Tax=Huijunlia imazamoxiresistens TaxID=3127457 RepID=UPI003016A633